MPEVIVLALALIIGAALGFFYFGGLWLTVRQIPLAKHPGLLVLLSLTIRMSAILLGFYLVLQGSWQRLAACLVGFFVIRFVLIRRLGPDAPQA